MPATLRSSAALPTLRRPRPGRMCPDRFPFPILSQLFRRQPVLRSEKRKHANIYCPAVLFICSYKFCPKNVFLWLGLLQTTI